MYVLKKVCGHLYILMCIYICAVTLIHMWGTSTCFMCTVSACNMRIIPHMLEHRACCNVKDTEKDAVMRRMQSRTISQIALHVNLAARPPPL